MSGAPSPKVELHLHLEGAAPPALIRGLAKQKNIDISGIFGEDGCYKFDNFTHFLKVYEAAASVLTGAEEYHRLTRAVLEESAAAGVVYTEVFLCPDLCGGGDLSAWRDILAAVTEAAATARRDGIEMRAIASAVRHLGPDAARRAARCAAETAGGALVGFGLAGNESRGRPRDFAYAFDMAREAGLRLTAHAGEWGGPQAIRDTLADLRVERIGHGVRAIEDLALVDELAEAGTVLECCPGSNIALGLYPGWRRHPIGELHRRGVKVTISTDDPPFFRTTMVREEERLAEAFDWDAAEFLSIHRTAARAAFCDPETRDRILNRLEEPS